MPSSCIDANLHFLQSSCTSSCTLKIITSCDIFGRITNNGKIPDFESIEIINKNQFIYSANGILIFQDLEKDQKTEIKIAEKSFKKFYYKDQILSIFTSEGITNYKIIIP